jgi:membrane-associated phospholipid phosphatase
MLRSRFGVLALALTAVQPSVALAQTQNARAWVQVDRERGILIVTAGPFQLPAHMADMPADMTMDVSLPVARFTWPFTTWLHGVQLQLVDARGRLLPRRLVHHFTIENFDRRDLIYPLAERLMSLGGETQDVSIPRMIGVPMRAGQRLGLWVMWNNTTASEIDGVYARLTLRLTAPDQQPPPLAVLPFHVDANLRVGGHNTFDVPPGGVVRTFDFVLPASGHLLAASGHLHDHGVSLVVEDRESGRAVVTVTADRDTLGHVLAVSRELLALWTAGPHLRAGHPYRLVVRYDNPTADTISDAMGILAGLFAPDQLNDWPALDVRDSAYATDLSLYAPTKLPAADTEQHPPVAVPAAGRHGLVHSLLLGSAGVLVTGLADNSIRSAMRRSGAEMHETGVAISRWSPRLEIGLGLAALGVGLGARSPALARTGRDALVAMSAAGVLTVGAKIVIGRERPSGGQGGESDAFEPFTFGSQDNSFPSGHTSQAFALAAVIAGHTHHRLLRIAVYGGAGAVGIARIAADRHFTSDVVAGAILGTIVGHGVVRRLAGGGQLSLTPLVAPGQLGISVRRPF